MAMKGKVDERIEEEEGKERGEEGGLVAYLCLEEVWLVTLSPMADIQQPGKKKTETAKNIKGGIKGH